jgi:hypothetical protein
MCECRYSFQEVLIKCAAYNCEARAGPLNPTLIVVKLRLLSASQNENLPDS